MALSASHVLMACSILPALVQLAMRFRARSAQATFLGRGQLVWRARVTRSILLAPVPQVARLFRLKMALQYARFVLISTIGMATTVKVAKHTKLLTTYQRVARQPAAGLSACAQEILQAVAAQMSSVTLQQF
jgi:hypothetical protein